MLRKPIFIASIHKSGATHLRTILDGHPNIFAIPFESHFFQLVNEYQFQLPVKLKKINTMER